MAGTATGTALTIAQRRDQERVRRAVAAEVLGVWPLLDPSRVDTTGPAWVQTVMAIISRHRLTAAQLAADYFLAMREAETDQLVPPPVLLAASIDTRQVGTSLLVTGPIGIKQRIAQGITPDKAARLALVEATGAATRHVVNGARQTLVDAVESDAEAVGFARVTGPHPCAFCAMLASRGFAYKSRESALTTGRRSKLGAGQRYHDHCMCGVEPTFSRGAPLPPDSARWEALWAASTRGKSGKAAMDAFQEAHAQVLDGQTAA